MKVVSLLLVFSLLLVACKKEIATATTASQLVQKEFYSCDCQSASAKETVSEYIKATIDGVPVCFDVMPAMNDTFPNMLKYGYIHRDTGDQYYDNLYMIRNARNSRWQAALFFENTHASIKSYPYNLPRLNSDYCEIGELQLNDQDHYVGCAWCPENVYNYYAQFWGEQGVRMTATSFKEGVFEGTFSGVVRTGNGKTASVANGQFRIRLVTYREDIDLH